MTLVPVRPFRPALTSATSLTPVTLAVQPEPPQLREEDLARIQEALTAAHAPGTLRTYAASWRLFEEWCRDQGHASLPAHPATVAAYLTERAEAGASTNSLNVACCAISHRHRNLDLPSPIHSDAVRRIRRGLRRIHGTAARRPAHPLDLDDIQRIVAAIDRTTVFGVRDAAMILLGFASALRVGEIAALRTTDLRPQPGGVVLHIRSSKTDPEGQGALVGVTAGSHAHTDPIAALDAWLDIRGPQAGFLFTTLRGHKGGRIHIDQPLRGIAISGIVHQRAVAAGLSAERITGHSLRAGHATTAALAGVPVDQIAAQTRHRQIDVLIRHYIRPAQTLQRSSSQHLGL